MAATVEIKMGKMLMMDEAGRKRGRCLFLDEMKRSIPKRSLPRACHLVSSNKVWSSAALLLFGLVVFLGPLPLGSSRAALADGTLLGWLHSLTAAAVRSELKVCNKAQFGEARCKEFSSDLADASNLRLIEPELVAKDATDERIARLLAGCDLKNGNHPFAEDGELGMSMTPLGPFGLYDGRLGNGGAQDAIVRAEGYRGPSDPEGPSYSWVTYNFVGADAPCHPTTYAHLSYGDLERPARFPHDDGIVLWRNEPFILAVWQLADGTDPAFVVSLYQLTRPSLQERSLALTVFLFLKPVTHN